MDSDVDDGGLTILSLCDLLQDILAENDFQDLPITRAWDGEHLGRDGVSVFSGEVVIG